LLAVLSTAEYSSVEWLQIHLGNRRLSSVGHGTVFYFWVRQNNVNILQRHPIMQRPFFTMLCSLWKLHCQLLVWRRKTSLPRETTVLT